MNYKIDYKILNEELGLEKDEIDTLLRMFFDTVENELRNLKIAIEKVNFEQIAELSHSIKGSSSNLRLTKIAEIAKNIELAAKERKSIDYNNKYLALKKAIESIKVNN